MLGDCKSISTCPLITDNARVWLEEDDSFEESDFQPVFNFFQEGEA